MITGADSGNQITMTTQIAFILMTMNQTATINYLKMMIATAFRK